MPGRRQLTLDLGHRPALGREDFLVSAGNAAAMAWLDRWPEWPAPALVVHGPAGCGKTHLAHVFAARSGAAIVDAAAIGREDPPLLVTAPALVVEDADRGGDQVALFHLFNLARESRCLVLWTGRSAPSRWGLTLPDLGSRLRAIPNVAIEPPDDALLAALLVKLFADRQLKVPAEVIAYVLPRLERSFAAARLVVETVDGLALEARREITVPLVREVLQRLDLSFGLN
jgi:chromosomal replication initiation ATPase DnaA